jgi:hypothetical protein
LLKGSAGFRDQRQTIPPVSSSWSAVAESNRVKRFCGPLGQPFPYGA